MMRDYADEACLHARICAMRSRLLTRGDYVSLAGQSGNSPDPAAPAPDAAAAAESVFRGQIAGIFPLVEATGRYVPLFLAFLRQFEAHNVKLVLAKAFGLSIPGQWHDIGRYAVLGQSRLREAIGLQDLRRLLAGTWLGDAFEGVASYEQAEARVDLCAASSLRAASDSFPREAKLDFQEWMAARIAVASTILSRRLEKTYGWQGDAIPPYLAALHGAAGGRADPQVKIVEAALDRHLDRVRAGGAQEPAEADVEHSLEQFDYNRISSMFHRDFHSITCVAAYLWMLFYQIRNLLRIVEGRRFGFPPERVMARIVCGA